MRKTTTDNDVVALKLFLGEGTVPSGSHPEQTLSLRLPRMAPPTGNGSITAVSWLARAALNVKWANDPDAEVPITVLSSEDRSTHGARSHPTVDTGGAVDLEFDLPSRVVHTGSVIAGKLHVVPREEVEAREVRIELVVCHASNAGYRRRSLVRASAVVNCQSMVEMAAFRRAAQALTAAPIAVWVGSRWRRHCRASTLNSSSAMFSQLPCLGV